VKEVLILIASYLIGSILIGDIIAKIKKVDLRTQGSGNVGATNVTRTMGAQYGIIVLGGDTLKGVLAVLLGAWVGGKIVGIDIELFCAVAAVAGHNWPIFAGFKGGKGMATSLGVSIVLVWKIVLPALGVWLLAFLLFGYVSLASVAVAVVFPFLIAFFYSGDLYRLLFGIVVAIFAIYKHRSNLQRLVRGEEHRLLYTKRKFNKGERPE
jgi:glycerol-3-phosphate acyltransferase PlsY